MLLTTHRRLLLGSLKWGSETTTEQKKEKRKLELKSLLTHLMMLFWLARAERASALFGVEILSTFRDNIFSKDLANERYVSVCECGNSIKKLWRDENPLWVLSSFFSSLRLVRSSSWGLIWIKFPMRVAMATETGAGWSWQRPETKL